MILNKINIKTLETTEYIKFLISTLYDCIDTDVIYLEYIHREGNEDAVLIKHKKTFKYRIGDILCNDYLEKTLSRAMTRSNKESEYEAELHDSAIYALKKAIIKMKEFEYLKDADDLGLY